MKLEQATAAQAVRERGHVKFFDNTWGFIKRQTGEDVFVHFSQVQPDGRGLFNDEEVEFEVVSGARGLSAINVQPVAA